MRLKHLELQGYKTFATKTEFIFDEGITAIVGPNGSGKSNIADAVRWVLGEQSYSLLRAKRTEDMIFSGSQQRARLGMAQVSLTFDNSDGWLPIEFTEVTIGRCAYRSGENEYLLNGSHVRLRDITELLGRSGLSRRSYTVIGQGLIDTALSLRPTERRVLFEEAAGISVYQTKREEALAKLEETHQNLLRVNDIIAELTPNLHRLEHQAERAKEQADVQRRLESVLRTWYGYRWTQGRIVLREANRRAQELESLLNSRRGELVELEQHVADLRARQGTLRQQLNDWRRQESTLHAQSAKIQRELAVAEERRRLLQARREEILAELAPVEEEIIAQRERMAAVEAEMIALQSQLEGQKARVREIQVQAEAGEARRQEVMSALTAARDQAFRLATEAADRRHRLAQLAERRGELERQQAEHAQALAALDNQAQDIEHQLSVIRRSLTELKARLAELQARQQDGRECIAANQQEQSYLQARLSGIRQEQTRLQARRDLLARMRQEGEGYYTGVRTVSQAASNGQLRGILGVVASLMQVPPDLERAIEVALGASLQDVIVETWADAETAIALLKRTNGGRATFLPLDILRPPRPRDLPREPGIIGLASDLVSFEERLRPAFETLLARTIVVRDLAAARRVLKELPGAFQLVTLEGELVRASGAVTGGTIKTQTGGLLAREREWRELPAALEANARQEQEIIAQLEQMLADERRYQEELTSLVAQSEALLKELSAQEETCRELERRLERITQDKTWQREIAARLVGELTTLDDKRNTWRDELAQLEAENVTVQARIVELQAELEALRPDEWAVQLAQQRTAVAVMEQRLSDQQAALHSQRTTLSQLEEQIAVRQKRIAQLTAENEELQRHIEQWQIEHEALLSDIQTLADCIEPAEAELNGLERSQTVMEEEEGRRRTLLRDYEARYNQARLEVGRREDELVSLRRQIEDDLGLVELDLEEISGQPPLPLHPLVSSLPTVQVLPEGLEEEIRRLRGRLHRIGAVNPNAPAEYAEALERHTFLTSQAHDLEQAAAHLRQVIAELDEIMEREFLQTFNAVAAEFEKSFTSLFGGGTARLVLTDPDNLMETGVDIIARPPGKRTQSLALLSGGERSLTAAALIFAILKVSPTPFCILDEVDAMLDEANVGRFRAALEELARHTQFIVITHNRGTIQAANTIYGISMGEDSVSRVISLKLEGEGVKRET
ncbi:MAG: chromosome segregation protein SMC [Anaerolineae bacterium]|jgi:chromosome segregation protein|nr:chromosome segregation protein SMC [Anaerolineae bacterium]